MKKKKNTLFWPIFKNVQDKWLKMLLIETMSSISGGFQTDTVSDNCGLLYLVLDLSFVSRVESTTMVWWWNSTFETP